MPDVRSGLDLLQSRPGRDIGIHGSVRLTRSLVLAPEVDELKIATVPVLRGDGERLLDGHVALRRMALADVQRTEHGPLMITYRLASP